MEKVRFNPWAVGLVVLMWQVLGFGWYAVFGTAWMNGLGRTMEDFQSAGPTPYLISFVAAIATALFMAWLVGIAGAKSAAHGARLGLLVGVALLVPSLATHYAFALIAWPVVLIDAGMEVVGTVLAGTILAAWAPRAAARPLRTASSAR